jgi:hypothetical protein
MAILAVLYSADGHYQAEILQDGRSDSEKFEPGGIYSGIALNEAMLKHALQTAYPDVAYVKGEYLDTILSQRKAQA